MAYREFYRRHLPHWQPEEAILFVTTRLAGSLPREVVERLRAETCNQPPHEAFLRWERALDAAKEAPRFLARPDIAAIVAVALHYRDGKVYDLFAYCIMPNHLHLVIKPLPRAEGGFWALSDIMGSLKRYTARRANQMLGRRGAFWQAESYDRVVRDVQSLRQILFYVVNNPVAAGLVNDWHAWRWTYLKPEFEEWLSL